MMTEPNIDSPVPHRQQLGCTLWKCYETATQGIGDGSVTWWTLQPIERRWWLDAADRLRDALIANPGMLDDEVIGRRIVTDECGGCLERGAHRRWCRASVGLAASIYGPMSERLESMGDTVGPNNFELSNRLWALSADMREWAKSLTERDRHDS